jgi:PhnB protein
MAVKPIPDGYHTVTPYLIVRGAAAALDFYKKAFGATELFRMPGPDGKIGHAEIRIGDSMIMLADEAPQMGALGPQATVRPPVCLCLYVEDVDTLAAQAVAAGAKELRPVRDQFYGDRSGMFEDPFGHVWNISTHKEDVAPDELQRRSEAAMKEYAGA